VVAPEDSATRRRPIQTPSPAQAPREARLIELIVAGPITRADIAALCVRARALLESGDADRLICDVGALADPDAVTIDALARLQLTARRLGCQVGLRNASRELEDLLDFVGLNGVLPPSARLPVEARRQPEEREVGGGVQEERDPADQAP
jgi:ABC-type transporter Mla MlaB component